MKVRKRKGKEKEKRKVKKIHAKREKRCHPIFPKKIKRKINISIKIQEKKRKEKKKTSNSYILKPFLKDKSGIFHELQQMFLHTNNPIFSFFY